MINSIKGLLLTLVSTMNGLRSPVTRQYPSTGTLWKREEAPTPVQDRFMGFPALTWDGEIEEPFCTSCMVCIRHCPTQCMTATMKDNPLQQEGKSTRRKIVDSFEINLNRCILCGICVEVCNFDAIVMSHEHEMSTFKRNGDRVNLPVLLEIGTKFQRETGWIPPTKRAKPEPEAAPAVAGDGETEGSE
jgi:formate hydrogenlyase subunit 6/NADH:ubiquinone oxidoreductase subunit I